MARHSKTKEVITQGGQSPVLVKFSDFSLNFPGISHGGSNIY